MSPQPARIERDDPSAYARNHDEVLVGLARAVNYNRWLFSRALPYLGSSMLDAGAGLGTFSELAAEHCEAVIATEPDPAYADYMRRRFADRPNVEVVNVDAVDLDSAQLGRSVDSIICFNVLEHVPDDAAALRRMHALLAPGGRLLLLVPAHEFLSAPYDRAVGHERRYAKGELENLLRRAGFDVHEARHVNPVGGVGWLVSMRLMGRSTMPFGQLGAFDRIVPFLRPLDRLRLPFGQSIWAVAARR
jgi:SAM-dependent methyltransferase